MRVFASTVQELVILLPPNLTLSRRDELPSGSPKMEQLSG